MCFINICILIELFTFEFLRILRFESDLWDYLLNKWATYIIHISVSS